MARIGLSNNRKFRHLTAALGSRLTARGALELLWEPCYETGDPYVGTSDDIEATVGWTGARGALTKALLEAGVPKGAGFIEPYEGSVRDATETHYQIHDFFRHCPPHVSSLHKRAIAKESRLCKVCGGEFFTRKSTALRTTSPYLPTSGVWPDARNDMTVNAVTACFGPPPSR